MNNLKALKKRTSGSNNKLRSDGFIPAILYGERSKSKYIVGKKEISNIINSDTFLSKVLK